MIKSPYVKLYDNIQIIQKQNKHVIIPSFGSPHVAGVMASQKKQNGNVIQLGVVLCY